MNLLYCGNEQVYDGVLLSLLSILRNTTSEVHVYLLTMDLRQVNETYRPITNDQTKKLKAVLQQANENNTIALCDITQEFIREMGNSVNLSNFYTPYCMLRLLVDCVPHLPEKILYLDTDTIAYGDPAPLYETDVNAYEIAGAIDYLGKIFKYPHYINSGVLLMNLDKMRETGLMRRTRQRCIAKKMAFPDQDALNREASLILRISSRYNSQRRRNKDTVIRHFCKSLRIFPYPHTINVKPWEEQRVRNKLKVTDLEELYEEWRKLK